MKLGLLFLPLLFASFAMAPANETKGNIKISRQNFGGNVEKASVSNWTIYQEENYPLSNMFDADEDTKAWLYNPSASSSITIELTSPVFLDDLFIKFAGGSDFLTSGDFYYYSDPVDPTYYLAGSFELSYNDTACVKCYGVEAKFIKLTNLTSFKNNWVQITEIGYNDGQFAGDLIQGVSENFTQGREANALYGYMFDGDDDTYTRFHRPNNNDHIIIKLKEAVEISSIRFKFFEDNDDECFYKGQFSYSIDGVAAYVPFDNYSSFIGNNYSAQYVDVRDNPVTAQYIKLTVLGYKGWVKIADISINTIPNDYYKVSVTGPTGLNQGCFANMFDNSSSTHAWFNSNVSSLIYDLRDVYQVSAIELQTGKVNNDGDYMIGEIQYSCDGSSWTKAVNISGQDIQSFAGLDFQARYIKLVNTNTGWTAIRIFNVTKATTKYVTQSGLVPVSGNDDLNDVVDNDLDTTFWSDWHFAVGSYIQVEYTNPITANNVVVLQGGYTSNGETADCFSSAKLEYSLNGSSWTKVADYSGELNILHEFVSPVELKYIRYTYTGGTASGTGAAFREFDINYVKHDITASFISNPSFSSETYKGYDGLPYGLDLSITYKNLRTNAVASSAIPTEISKYEVKLFSEGNAAYNPVDVTTTMTVQDTADNFKDEFEALLVNGSICSAISGDKMNELIYRYDNCLSSGEKDLLDAMTFEDSDGNDMLISAAIEYARTKTSYSNNNGLNISSKADDKQISVVIAIVSVSAIIFVLSFVYIRSKKAKE